MHFPLFSAILYILKMTIAMVIMLWLVTLTIVFFCQNWHTSELMMYCQCQAQKSRGKEKASNQRLTQSKLLKSILKELAKGSIQWGTALVLCYWRSTLANSSIDFSIAPLRLWKTLYSPYYYNARHQQYKNYYEPSKTPYDSNRSCEGFILRHHESKVLRDLRFC